MSGTRWGAPSRRRLRWFVGFPRRLFESAALIGDGQRLHQPIQPLLRRPLPERPLPQFFRILPTAKIWRRRQFVRAHAYFFSSCSSARRLASSRSFGRPAARLIAIKCATLATRTSAVANGSNSESWDRGSKNPWASSGQFNRPRRCLGAPLWARKVCYFKGLLGFLKDKDPAWWNGKLRRNGRSMLAAPVRS